MTTGTVVDVNADFYIEHSFGTFLFTNQVVIEGDDDNFAGHGDSGSVVVDVGDEEGPKAVALIFAEAGRFAVACTLELVFSELKPVVGGDIELVMD